MIEKGGKQRLPARVRPSIRLNGALSSYKTCFRLYSNWTNCGGTVLVVFMQGKMNASAAFMQGKDESADCVHARQTEITRTALH